MDKNNELKAMIYRGLLFIQRYARSEGGFFPQALGIGDGNEVAPTSSNCSEAIYRAGNGKSNSIKQDVDNIFYLQINEGKHRNAWCRNEGPSVWATTKAIIAILTIYPSLHDDCRIVGAIDWLKRQKNSDGSYGLMRSYPSRPFYTYYVFQVYLMMYRVGKQQKKYYGYLNDIAKSLLGTKVNQGIWSNGSNKNPCAGSTLVALSCIIAFENMSSKQVVNEYFKESGKAFIKEQLSAHENWLKLEWSEPGKAFDIQIFPPEALPSMIIIFGKNDSLIASVIQWVVDNRIEFNGTYGWKWPSTEIEKNEPYTWTTAVVVKSLYSYLENDGTEVAPINFFRKIYYDVVVFLKKPIHLIDLLKRNDTASVVTIIGIIVTVVCTLVGIYGLPGFLKNLVSIIF